MRFAFGTKFAQFLLHLHLIMHLILALFNLTAKIKDNYKYDVVLVLDRLVALLNNNNYQIDHRKYLINL